MPESFNTTRWSIIDKARGDERTARRDALQELLTCYMPALRAHLVRRKRLSPELADEILQGFLVKNIVEGKLVERADASAGKFRSWLLKWLENYVRHELSRAKRETAVEDFEEAASETGSDGFDADWARTTLAEAVQLMKEECRRENKPERWTIFERRLLAPLLSDVEPADYDDLVTDLQLTSKAQAQNHLVSAKRHFNRSLETVIGRYVENEEEIEAEVRELQRVLASASTAKQPLVVHDDEHTITSHAMVNVITSDPQRIVKLFDLNVAFIWQQCLDTPICELLGEESRDVDPQLTLRDGLHHPQPSVQLLRKLKQFGNTVVQADSLDWPVDVGLAIYVTAIASGQARLGTWISSASLSALQPGFDFLRAGNWLDETTLDIHRQAIEQHSR